MNETQVALKRLYDEASATLGLVDSPGEAEPEMAKFLHAVNAHPEERPFVSEMFKQSLTQPGAPWEFVQFCLHGLRWPEVQEFLQASRSRDIDNLRARPIWEHLLDAFKDDWEDAEFYKEYAT